VLERFLGQVAREQAKPAARGCRKQVHALDHEAPLVGLLAEDLAVGQHVPVLGEEDPGVRGRPHLELLETGGADVGPEQRSAGVPCRDAGHDARLTRPAEGQP
jgi:hypothetical protein